MSRLSGRAVTPLVVSGVVVLAACDRDAGRRAARRPPPAEPAAAESAAAYHAERLRDVTGDGFPERLAVDAAGGRDDSLVVRLAIHSRATDSLLYADRWRSADYFKYIGPPAALPADSVRRVVRRHLGALFADSAFTPASEPGDDAARRNAPDFDAIRYDVAEHRFRAAHQLAREEPLPHDAHDAIERTVRTPAVTTRAAALARELRGKPTFRYYAGGELTYGVAWSEAERRFVRVYACC